MKRRDVVFTILAIAFISIVVYLPSLKQKAQSVSCGNYMSSIGLATRVWSDDNHNILPGNFVVMSNELATTKVLICPSDRIRQPATNWVSFKATNSSYALLTPGAPWNGTNAFLRCEIHGHLGYADGTVFDGKRRRTKLPY
jgi:hypothetical protein